VHKLNQVDNLIPAPQNSSRPWQTSIYGLILGAAVSLWFLAFRAPLWLDETISFWQIKKGFGGILRRQGGLAFPAYSYILWLWTTLLGTTETALRMSAVLAMLSAVFFLYRAARELFDPEIAFITAILFCIHPIVIFTSIDVRPYAFAALATTASIFVLVRLRHSDSRALAALFGLLAAVIVYFHFIYGAMLPALAVGFFLVKLDDRKNFLRQLCFALAAFCLAFSLVIPGLLYMLRTRGSHVWDIAPPLSELGWTLAPGWLIYVFLGIALVAAATWKLDVSNRPQWRDALLCASLGLIPILILYGISVATPLHIFVARYRLVAIPGIALSWGWIFTRINSRPLRLVFCVAIVAATAYQYWHSPFSRQHAYSWKYAIAAAEQATAQDHAPVLICSDLPEADYTPMPTGEVVKDSTYFPFLTYYPLTSPVVALPRALNDQAMRIGSEFLRRAAVKRQRFLAMAFAPSYPTLQWLAYNSTGMFTVRQLGTYDDVLLLEFVPVDSAASPVSP